MKQVENWALENQGYQLRRKIRLLNKSKTRLLPSNLLTIFLYGMLMAERGPFLFSLVGEGVYEVGILLALGKGKSSIFLQFCFRGGLGISQCPSILYRWKCHYILSAPNPTSKWRSGKLTDTLAKTNGLSTSILSFAESYVF